MSNAAIEVQLRELKDLTAQLNTTVKQQSNTISAMTDLLASKDQRIAELSFALFVRLCSVLLLSGCLSGT